MSNRFSPDLGIHLPFIGSVYRPFNETTYDHTDSVVDKFALLYDVNRKDWESLYNVTPKLLKASHVSLRRYDKDPDPYDEIVSHYYDVARDWADKEFGPFLQGSRLTTVDQVLEHLESDKSPGYPWTLGYTSKGDYWLFGPFSEFYDRYWLRLGTPNPISTLCSVSLKKELRPSEKIQLGRIRTTTAMDVNHIVASNVLFLDQNERLMNSRMSHSVVLGIIPHLGGWHDLVNHMMPYGNTASSFELDGSEFDGRFYQRQMNDVRLLRYSWLRREFRTVENAWRAYNLYYDLVHGPLVNVDGSCYDRGCGNPSGQGNTTPDNCIKSFMDVCVLWQILVPAEFHTYECFKLFLRICINGDDFNYTVDPRFLQWFNNTRIKEVQHLIGMVYTSPTDEPRLFHETSFLSHEFRLTTLSNGVSMYMPVIDAKKMKASLLRYNESGTVFETITRLCGIRTETWADAEMRKWIADLREFILTEYASKYRGRAEWELAWKGWKTDRELESLYSGFSIRQSGAVPLTALNSELNTTRMQNRFSTNSTSRLLSKVGHTLADLASKKMPHKPKPKAKVKTEVKVNVSTPAQKTKRKRNRKRANMDTHVRAPVSKGTIHHARPTAKFHNGKDGSVTISHEEYVCSIGSATGYNVAFNGPLNAASSVTFPWLSTIASRFRKYRFNTVAVRYQPTCSSSTPGLVGSVATYRTADAWANTGPPDMKSFVQSGSTMGNAWTAFTYKLSHKSLNVERAYYIDSGAEADPIDEPDTPGRLFVCTNGAVSSGDIGLVFIRYSITLMEPTFLGPEPVQQFGHISGNTASGANILGGTSTVTGTLMSVGGTGANTAVYINQAGSYHMLIRVTGSSINSNVTTTALNGTNNIGLVGSTWVGGEITQVIYLRTNVNFTQLKFTLFNTGATVTGTTFWLYPVSRDNYDDAAASTSHEEKEEEFEDIRNPTLSTPSEGAISRALALLSRAGVSVKPDP